MPVAFCVQFEYVFRYLDPARNSEKSLSKKQGKKLQKIHEPKKIHLFCAKGSFRDKFFSRNSNSVAGPLAYLT